MKSINEKKIKKEINLTDKNKLPVFEMDFENSYPCLIDYLLTNNLSRVLTLTDH